MHGRIFFRPTFTRRDDGPFFFSHPRYCPAKVVPSQASQTADTGKQSCAAMTEILQQVAAAAQSAGGNAEVVVTKVVGNENAQAPPPKAAPTATDTTNPDADAGARGRFPTSGNAAGRSATTILIVILLATLLA